MCFSISIKLFSRCYWTWHWNEVSQRKNVRHFILISMLSISHTKYIPCKFIFLGYWVVLFAFDSNYVEFLPWICLPSQSFPSPSGFKLRKSNSTCINLVLNWCSSAEAIYLNFPNGLKSQLPVFWWLQFDFIYCGFTIRDFDWSWEVRPSK